MTILFKTVLSMSVGAGVLGLMVLIARAIVGRRQTVALTLMFALLIARLIVPINIESKASILNLVPSEFAQTEAAVDTGVSEADNTYIPAIATERDSAVADAAQVQYDTTANEPAIEEPATAAAQNVTELSETIQPRSIDYWQLAAYAWIAGMAVLALIIFISNVLFMRKVRGNRDYVSPGLGELIDQCAAEFGIEQKIKAVQMSEINNVAVCGIFRPKLLISPEAFEGLTTQEKRDVIMHEMSHIKRKDTLTSLILTIVSVLHWFNPVVWLAFAVFRKDMEVMCDSKVLCKMEAWQRKRYAETLFKLAKNTNGRNPKIAMALFMSKASIKRRIAMIAKYKRNKPIVVALALILVVGLAVTGCTSRIGEKNIEQTQTIQQEEGIGLIGSSTLDYTGFIENKETSRVNNIQKAAEKLNGLTLKPDNDYSFKNILGNVDEENGWGNAKGVTWMTVDMLINTRDANDESIVAADQQAELLGGGAELVAAVLSISMEQSHLDVLFSGRYSGLLPDGDIGLYNWFDNDVMIETIDENNRITVNIYGPNDLEYQLWQIGTKIAEQTEGEIAQVQTEYGNRIGQFSIDFSFCADNVDIVNNINLAAKETDGKVFKQGMGEILLDDSISKEDGWKSAPAIDPNALSRLTFDTIDNIDSLLTSYEVGGGKELVVTAIKGAALKAGLSVGSFDPDEDIINEYYGDVTLRVFVENNAITAEFYCDNPTFPQMMSSYSYDYQGRYLDQSFLNVDKALSKLGVIEIAPGEEISLNKIVGNRATQDGWVIANDIAVAHNETEAGGGACIAATAIYNAAILAELEVTEVTHHSILPYDMPAGLDATFSYDNGDLKIKNPYNVSVYIEAGFREGNIVSKVYGPLMDHVVEFNAQQEVIGVIPAPVINYNEMTVPGGITRIPDGEAVKFIEGKPQSICEVHKTIYDLEGNEIETVLFDTVEYEAYPAQIYVNGDTYEGR